MKGLIVYYSDFDLNQSYAYALHHLLHFPILPLEELDTQTLDQYDVVIVGTWILQGEIRQAKKINSLIEAFPQPFWVFYTVGISTPSLTNFETIMQRSFSAKALKRMVAYHYRLRIASKRFTLMYLASKQMTMQPGTTLDEVYLGPEGLHLLEKYGSMVEPNDLKEIGPLVKYVEALEAFVD